MPNALAAETSPYLRQHADNPVAWLPWGETAFARARAEQKPIFLSIGYSTCHWCHVMAHESFENEAIAELLNTHFIPVKVDREERPDVDRVYMAYVQALTGHGGWPLSAWLTPELKPFHGGTYYPPEDRHGRQGFPSLLRAIARGWAENRTVLVNEAERVLGVLRGRAATASQAVGASAAAQGDQLADFDLHEAGSAAFERAFDYYQESFDATYGGFGGAPKFPRASNLHFLLRAALVQGVGREAGREALGMVTTTLRQMTAGGLHDHVGGGFHRYSVDATWFVPHFEKMLYDQAQIAVNCLDAHHLSGDERFAWVAGDILDYTLRDLAHPEGGFYSAEDADSPVPPDPEVASPVAASATVSAGAHAAAAEGAFYVWTLPELQAALGGDDAVLALVCTHFGVEPEGNVPSELDPHGEFTGKNILRQVLPIAETARRCGLAVEEAAERLARALLVLRAVRARRPRPHLDDKIITAWNGLMLSALARAATSPAACLVERREAYLAAALRTARFVERELFDPVRGVLFRCFRGTRAPTEGFAEDYAALIAGLLDLYEATFATQWLAWARQLQATMEHGFGDAQAGGYFNSRAEAADLVLRLKEDYDGAEAAPTSLAAGNLFRLAAFFGDEGFAQRGLRAVLSLRERWQATPQALPELLTAVERALTPPRHVVLVGDPASPTFQALLAVARSHQGPRQALIGLIDAAARPWWATQAPWLADLPTLPPGLAAAYVCADYACQLPVREPEELARLLAH